MTVKDRFSGKPPACAAISRRGLLVAGAGLTGGLLNVPYLNRSGAQARTPP